MDVKIIASSQSGESVTREEFELLGGRIAGINMMNESYEKMLDEERSKTQRRIKQTKASGHHHVYAHNSITLYLDKVPKILAYILGAMKQNVSVGQTYEDDSSAKTQILYKKWVEIFKNKIDKINKSTNVNMTDAGVLSLARYYAGYITSVFAPISLVYTTNYTSFNYLVSAIEKFMAKENKSDLEEKCAPHLEELMTKMKELPYYDSELALAVYSDKLGLFADDKPTEEYFGDVYSTSYDASFLELGEALTYKSITYSMHAYEGKFHIPEIIADSESFSELWISDLEEIADTYPEATLLSVHEIGTLDGFLTKLNTCRKSYRTQEINEISEETFKKYEYALRMKIHPRAEEIIAYTKTEDK